MEIPAHRGRADLGTVWERSGGSVHHPTQHSLSTLCLCSNQPKSQLKIVIQLHFCGLVMALHTAVLILLLSLTTTTSNIFIISGLNVSMIASFLAFAGLLCPPWVARFA